MALPTTALGTKLRILRETDTPGTYAQPCSISTKGINFQTNTNEFFVSDCAAPDDPAWRKLAKSGRFASVTGSGTLAMEHITEYRDDYDSDTGRNYRVELDLLLADNGGYWEGSFMLTNLNITGNDGELVQVELTLESDGAVAWTDAAV